VGLVGVLGGVGWSGKQSPRDFLKVGISEGTREIRG
jgi:hypothetical protein